MPSRQPGPSVGFVTTDPQRRRPRLPQWLGAIDPEFVSGMPETRHAAGMPRLVQGVTPP